MDETFEGTGTSRRELFAGAGVATAAVFAGSMLSGPAGAAAPTPSGAAIAPKTLPLSTVYGESQSRSPEGIVNVGSRWWITVNPGGDRTAYSISHSPDGTSVREVMQSVTADWHPISGMCRTIINGKPQGTISKFVVGDRIKSIFADGTVFDEREFPLPQPGSIGFHAGLGDGWHFASVLLEKGRKQQIAIHTSSATWNAATLGHGETLHDGAEYLGEEDTSVGGLVLRCRTYLWSTSFGRTIKVWVYGEHNISARMEVLTTPAEFKPGTVYSLRTLQYLSW